MSDHEFQHMVLVYNGQTMTLCDLGFRVHRVMLKNMLF